MSDASLVHDLLDEGYRVDIIARAFGITERRVIELANSWYERQSLINEKRKKAIKKTQKRQRAKDFIAIKDEELVFMRFDGMTYRAIAKQVQLSTERVRQRVMRYARRMNRGIRNTHFKVIHGEEG